MDSRYNTRYIDEEGLGRAEEAQEAEETQEKIRKEEARLKRLFSKIDPSKKKLVFSTISDVAFLTISMENLRKAILRDGTTVVYKNGENQYGTKQNPDAQLYLQMSQKLTAAMKILVDCLPKADKKVQAKSDGFEEFLQERSD